MHRKISWWLYPEKLICFLVAPLAIFAMYSANQVIASNESGYDVYNFIDLRYSIYLLFGLFSVAAGAYVGSRIKPPLKRGYTTLQPYGLDFLFVCCVIGYLTWFSGLVLNNFGLVIGALTGSPGAIYRVRDLADHLAGITTLTQFGVAYACVFARRWVIDREAIKRHKLFFGVICVLAIFRAAIYSERLAFIEVVFPVFVTWAYSSASAASRLRRIIRFSLPLVMIFGGIVFFLIFEYNRSWVNFYQYKYDNIFDFALQRFSIYYVSSINNICGFMRTTPWPNLTGDWTFRWLYKFPGLNLVFGDLGESTRVLFKNFLEARADPEFNNSTGLLIALQDWGVSGGIFFLFLYGFVAGYAFRQFRTGVGLWGLFYPVILYSFFEILRIGYIFDGRTFAVLVGLALSCFLWGRVGNPRLSVRAL